MQAGGGRASSEGRATASGAEGAARERLGARRPLKDMPESGRELPTRGWSRLSASQVAAHPLLGARGPILRPLAGGQSCCPWLGNGAGAQHQPPQQAQGPRGGGGSPTPSWGGAQHGAKPGWVARSPRSDVFEVPSLLPPLAAPFPPAISPNAPFPARPLCSNPSLPLKPLSSPNELTWSQTRCSQGAACRQAPLSALPLPLLQVFGVCKSPKASEGSQQTGQGWPGLVPSC